MLAGNREGCLSPCFSVSPSVKRGGEGQRDRAGARVLGQPRPRLCDEGQGGRQLEQIKRLWPGSSPDGSPPHLCLRAGRPPPGPAGARASQERWAPGYTSTPHRTAEPSVCPLPVTAPPPAPVQASQGPALLRLAPGGWLAEVEARSPARGRPWADPRGHTHLLGAPGRAVLQVRALGSQKRRQSAGLRGWAWRRVPDQPTLQGGPWPEPLSVPITAPRAACQALSPPAGGRRLRKGWGPAAPPRASAVSRDTPAPEWTQPRAPRRHRRGSDRGSPDPREAHQDRCIQLLPPEPVLQSQQLALALKQLELQLVHLLAQLADLLPQHVLLLQAAGLLRVQLLPRHDGLWGGSAGRGRRWGPRKRSTGRPISSRVPARRAGGGPALASSSVLKHVLRVWGRKRDTGA